MFHDVSLGGGVLAPLVDDGARAADNLDGFTVLVVLAEADPFAEKLAVLDLVKRDGVLVAESGDQLGVVGFIARVGEHAKVGFTAIQALDGLVETTGKAIVAQGSAKHLLEGAQGVKRGLLFDLLFHGLFDINGGFFGLGFVRHDY